jgi:hypothetical protein
MLPRSAACPRPAGRARDRDHRWPQDDAVLQALTALRTLPPPIDLVRLVLFDDDTRQAAERVRQTLHDPATRRPGA